MGHYCTKNKLLECLVLSEKKLYEIGTRLEHFPCEPLNMPCTGDWALEFQVCSTSEKEHQCVNILWRCM
jgi:hypothetical protein